MNETTNPLVNGSPWSIPEPEIPLSAIADTIETEVLICGAGNAGLMAAISAAKLGARTLIIEKNKGSGL